MSPPSQENMSIRQERLATDKIGDGDKIVISGISGLYPKAHNIKEFSEMLYNKENSVTLQDRWDYKYPELPKYIGSAPDLERFDAQFFTVNYRLGNCMDPMSRKMLEQTYQALYDAGLSPGAINGKKVAVVIGSSFSETEKDGCINGLAKFGLGIVGTSKTMFANRISYWLNLKGPSLSIDQADCSSTVALEQAFLAIRRGECEAAIVGGAHLCLFPQALVHHARLGVTSKDGKTNSFDQNSNGYTLSDLVGVLVLQKAKNALRCYAELVHVKTKFLYPTKDDKGPKFGYYRNSEISAEFVKDFYKEAKVSPQVVEYVEGYGTGVPDVDKSELETIEKVYCENRKIPLLVGSITSNIGLTEGASGIAAISKILLGYHKGELAANLDCKNPRQDVDALRDGRIRIVTEHQHFQREYTAVNGMSSTGINSHVLLKGMFKPKNLLQYRSSIPRLVVLSGRQESNIQKIIDDLKSRPVDAEEIALLHNIHSMNISGHLGRGYTILDSNDKTVSQCEKIEYFDDARRPLWFVYSGMGSQWAGMGAQLMRIPIFESAIQRCERALKPMGLDIVHIITSPDKAIFDNILHAFVGIAAVQIGLTDILRELGLIPDGIIGHSVGELGCAYADGCMTAEEMILAAYSRGLVSLQTPLIRGSMAAIALGYNQISTMCPPEIDVACRNGPDSSTISGPAEIMRSFVTELTAKGIFAKEVQCANIAYHSRYIADAGPSLLKYLNEVINNPKRRSERWLSTSVPQDKWNEVSAQYCSAEYHTNNLLKPVLFEETLRLIPSNAVLVEVAPHGLLQAILTRSLPADCKHVPLTRRGHADNTLYLLQAIGNLYMSGYTPNVQVLYPKVQFPVSTETPMLSHLVEWVHNEEWSVTAIKSRTKENDSACTFVLSIHDDEHNYLQGNVIRGKMCYPYAAALVAVWDMLSMNAGVPKRETSVRFRDLHLYAQPLLLDQQDLKLNVALHRGTGWFEVINDHSRVISGYHIMNVKTTTEFMNTCHKSTSDHNDMELTSEDIYQLLNDREYKYSGEFRSIECASASLDEAAIVWRDNWVTLIDGMLQLNVLRQAHHAVSQPTHIRQLCIDVKEHVNSHLININGKHVMKAIVDNIHDTTSCGGIIIRNIKFRNLALSNNDLQLELYIPPYNAMNRNEINAQPGIATNKMLQSAEIGNLDSLEWVQVPEIEKPKFAVKVHFTGLNLLDVKRAIGVTSCDINMYGMDYSGTTNSGERVMGIVSGGAASSQVRAQPELLWPVPAHWSLEDAATVPLAYAHAFYALAIKAHLQPGMSVLVHGGTGALGQAVIAIALAHDCQIFATVSDVRKKKFLRKRFPHIKDEHIGNSRDVTFSDIILTATKGRGCKIVISCVKGECKNFSLKCCESYGTVIDTVQIQEREIFEYGMMNMTKARSYLTIDFTSLFTNNKYEEMKAIQRMLSDGIAAGYVVPLTRVTYVPHEAARAFRLLGASRHRGRVLLRMCDDDGTAQLQHRMICDPNQCQVLFWDNDGVGAQVADRLISRGATNLYIVCTTFTNYIRIKLRFWQQLGVKVLVSSKDISETALQASLDGALSLGMIEGIIIVTTNLLGKQSTKTVSSIIKNIDCTSRLLSPALRYFTVVSTVQGVGQDTCTSRVNCGLTATYLDLSSLKEEEVWKCLREGGVIEQALCNKHPLIEVQRKYVQPRPFVEQIAALSDLKITSKLDMNLTLQELGIKEEHIQSISAFLNSYNIYVDELAIPFLTINEINDMQKSVTDVTPPSNRGLRTFFTKINPDEIHATADLILLPTLYTGVVSIDNECPLNERYLCIIPGMEGQYEKFLAICERLKMPALVLQPGLDHPHETVKETAQRYLKVLKNKTQILDNFYILGYESGVMVALELAAILEDQGLTGTVFCLGLALNELQIELEKQLRNLETKEQLQDAVMRHMFTLLSGEDTTLLDNALQQAVTWTEKMNVCLRYLRGRMSHSTQFAHDLIEAAVARIEQVRLYKPMAYSLRSQLVLLRAATTHASHHATTLQQHTQRPIVVHQLRSPLDHVLNDMQCASLINRYLDDDIQKIFNTKNLCEYYPPQET